MVRKARRDGLLLPAAAAFCYAPTRRRVIFEMIENDELVLLLVQEP
jgi:hypothetical protein